ncbi:hypothetical protein N7532_004508 [Penicillium argentinense]|uniref:Calcineurin-like phosphoesterase domain-containing protein n=1 Tax=Penicillium argentinense TaxID=1131581 RepID=A0A9W9KEZ3_9EURO|nr:uncharacterized protein N7532_004508 [Penicillium argentinense]KAJ5103979.1 hypothetical protein N7532_004508 [Penicillium argentinense]
MNSFLYSPGVRLALLVVMQAILGFGSFVNASTPSLPGAASYVAPAGFPTSVFVRHRSYYESPALPTREPQPIIYDPVLDITFPFELTNPDIIPENSDERLFPNPKANLLPHEKAGLINDVMANVTNIIKSNNTESHCAKCKRALAAAKPAALYTPLKAPDAMVHLCKAFSFASNLTCEETYSWNAFGPIWTQVLAYADVEGLDGDYICNNLKSSFCPQPHAQPLHNSQSLFPKPKPENPTVPKASGKRIKVLHMSDLHLDARFSVNSEANCLSYLCCRSGNHNKSTPEILLPASPYGSFKCDTPYDLALAALQAVGPLTGTGKSTCGGKGALAFTLYTGDMASHDPEHQISQRYLEYIETSIFDMFKHYLSGPVFVALGNHDSAPSNIDAAHNLPGRLGQQMSWNYDHVSGLWEHEGWISHETAKEARTHYGGYSVKTHYGLRILSYNTDLWYKHNTLNLINTTNPDNSGMLSWIIEELQKAEDEGERVWLIGHVLSGWDGYNPMPDPTNIFYQIVDRYSPHVIANIFFGHNHEDQFMVYYANNGTVQNAENALATGWIMPSLTPLTNLNSAFRMYEVDTGDFNVYEAYTFYSNVSEYPSLHGEGPTYKLEYSTRDTYGPAAEWPTDAPLNATFWHRVTEGMEKDLSLVSWHNTLQGKMSEKSPNCTTEVCQKAKICYMRSGSAPLGYLCKQGYGSVQSPFKEK